MKRISLLSILLLPLFLYSQQWPMPQDSGSHHKQKHSIGIGVKAGFNFSNVTNASQINAASRTGYHIGIFLAPQSKSIISSRTELLYSRHGYSYSDSTAKANGSIDLDYVMLAQYICLNITKYIQIQFGGQTGYLLSAKADSGQTTNTGNAQANSVLSYYNRFQYGYGGGIEIHPYSGLLIGATYIISLNNLYNFSSSSYVSGAMPSFAPNVNLKNNIIQISVGWRF
jgi:outer membrane protein with beta-barrel domain